MKNKPEELLLSILEISSAIREVAAEVVGGNISRDRLESSIKNSIEMSKILVHQLMQLDKNKESEPGPFGQWDRTPKEDGDVVEETQTGAKESNIRLAVDIANDLAGKIRDGCTQVDPSNLEEMSVQIREVRENINALNSTIRTIEHLSTLESLDKASAALFTLDGGF